MNVKARRSSNSTTSPGFFWASSSNFSDKARTRSTTRPSRTEVDRISPAHAEISTAGVIIEVNTPMSVGILQLVDGKWLPFTIFHALMVPLSVLDLAPITQGSDAATALKNSLELAQLAERVGYRRFWVAEHHNMPGIASAATAVVIGHLAAGTSVIRVGAGGIMLPNHAPLVVAEQFGTLESLFPGRIDLGLGRAPGSDHATARALRRTLASNPDAFPHDVLELLSYFEPRDASDPPGTIRAVPGAGLRIPLYILGSSLFGAQVAAALGLPFAFASHFAAPG